MTEFKITFETNKGRILTLNIKEDIGDMDVDLFLNSIHEEVLFHVVDRDFDFNPEGLACDDKLEFCLKVISMEVV